MGYTHYWEREFRPFPKRMWDRFVKDVRPKLKGLLMEEKLSEI